MSLVRIMVRSLTMIPVFISIFWTVLPGYGIFVAIMGSWLAIALAELDILNALRTRVVITGTILFNLLIVVVLNWLVQLTSISELFGGTSVLVAHTLLWSILGVGSVVLGLRLMAKRSGAWFFVEMGLIALATAVIFFPHQYKIVIRPLWLSDLAWSIGLEPSVALGLIGLAERNEM